MDETQISEETLLITNENYLILGGPGTGKTVLIKRLILKILNSEDREKYGVPILIRAREIYNGSILNEVKRILGIEHVNSSDAFSLINNNKIILFIDGLDEVMPENNDILIKELTDLYRFSTVSRIISTSRHRFSLPRCKYCEILPLNNQQLIELINLNLSAKESNEFSNQLIHLNLKLNPLTISSTIDIFQRYGQLPNKKIHIYKHWIDLCINDWDKIRMVSRKSVYPTLIAEQKYFILSFIAFDLTFEHPSKSYSKSQIFSSLSKLTQRLELEPENFFVLLDDIVTNTGIMIESESDTYQFVHRSIQEYLAADYLVKLPKIRYDDLLVKVPSILALCVLISSDPAYYYAVVLDTIKFTADNEESMYIFLLSLFSQAEKKEVELFYNITNSEVVYKSEGNAHLYEIVKTAYNKSIAASGADE